MNLLLICETAIIEQIFSLVCKKLNIDLTITQSNDVSEKFDLIIVDQNFIDDKFNIIKQFSKRLGAISSEELPFDKSRDFIIPRPFLPTKLQEILKEQSEIILQDDISEKADKSTPSSTYIDNNEYKDEYEEDEEVTVPIITDYVESLAEDVYLDIEDDNDESIVSMASLNNGGILDNHELSKINDILKEEVIHNEVVMNKNDWKDISNIIDDALDEVKEYEFDLNESNSQTSDPLNLVLSDYNINELKPLLEKFNQETIDRLSHGESIDIRLVLKEQN
jgi:hypothetical protein